MLHGNEAWIVPRFPSNRRCDKIGHFQHGFFNIASYNLNCLGISRFSDSPWDLEAKSWDRELIRAQTVSLTVKPWELIGLQRVKKRKKGKRKKERKAVPFEILFEIYTQFATALLFYRTWFSLFFCWVDPLLQDPLLLFQCYGGPCKVNCSRKERHYHWGDFVFDCSIIILSGQPPLFKKSWIRHWQL